MQENVEEFNRGVTLFELKLLSQDTNHKIDALTEKLSGLVTSMGEMRIQVDTNAKEIDKLRTHYHDLANIVQIDHGKSEIMSTQDRRELIRLLPFIRDSKAMTERRGLTDVSTPEELEWVQTANRDIGKDNIKVIAANLAHQRQRDVRWFGLSREFVIGFIGLVTVLVASHGDAIWHALFG